MPRTLAMFVAGLLLRTACLAEGPVFDAASVKVSDSGVRQSSYSGGPGTSDPGRLRLHINMAALFQAAFGVQVDQITGGPPWLRDFSAMPFYDIDATMPAATTKKQCEEMLQTLLVERFHAVFHHDIRNFPGYELVVDKDGSKLKEAGADPEPATTTNGGVGTDGFPTARGARAMGYGSTAYQRRKFQEYTMAAFAANLGLLIGRAQGKSLDPNGSLQPRVADKTGLTGEYTFILEYNCPACAPLVATSATQENAPAASDPGGFPDLFGAIQKQLGLRLDKAKDVSTDVIVIESLDKTPTPN